MWQGNGTGMLATNMKNPSSKIDIRFVIEREHLAKTKSGMPEQDEKKPEP